LGMGHFGITPRPKNSRVGQSKVGVCRDDADLVAHVEQVIGIVVAEIDRTYVEPVGLGLGQGSAAAHRRGRQGHPQHHPANRRGQEMIDIVQPHRLGSAAAQRCGGPSRPPYRNLSRPANASALRHFLPLLPSMQRPERTHSQRD